MGIGVLVEELECVDKTCSNNWISSNADAGRLTDSSTGNLPDRLIGQCSASGDHTHVSLPIYSARHDPNLALARGDDAGTVGPDQAASGARERGCDADHVEDRDPLSDANDERNVGVCSFQDGVGGKGRRNKDRAGICALVLHCFPNCVENRDVLMTRFPFAGSHSGHDPPDRP